MKQGQISQEQIIGILQQAERGEHTVAAICRAHGITETTFYRWRKKYGDMTVAEAARLRELERENARLKRLLAERDLELAAIKQPLTIKPLKPHDQAQPERFLVDVAGCLLNAWPVPS